MPERRHIFVLFADVRGSTELAMSRTPEDYNEKIRAYHVMAHGVVHAYRSEFGLTEERLYARAVGDECLAMLSGGPVQEDAAHALRLAVRLKQGWSTPK